MKQNIEATVSIFDKIKNVHIIVVLCGVIVSCAFYINTLRNDINHNIIDIQELKLDVTTNNNQFEKFVEKHLEDHKIEQNMLYVKLDDMNKILIVQQNEFKHLRAEVNKLTKVK